MRDQDFRWGRSLLPRRRVAGQYLEDPWSIITFVRFEGIAIHFLEARLNEAALRQTLSRVWCRQQWWEDKVG
jgi:hypothetical protein